ncbi:hypothetical protein HK405_008939 [Cladochytrium tenue]|nr:hypothetical protein HK405_008939 [Cladochytrium tenue]
MVVVSLSLAVVLALAPAAQQAFAATPALRDPAAAAASHFPLPTSHWEYVCNVSAYPAIPADHWRNAAAVPAAVLADLAHYSSAPPGLAATLYTHASDIDGAAGRYHTDCSCYLSFLMHCCSPALRAAWHRVAADPAPEVRPPAPRAGNFFDLLAALPNYDDDGDRDVDGGDAIGLGAASDAPRDPLWRRVERVRDLRPGDLVAWRVPGAPGNADTGHVTVVIDRRDEGADGAGFPAITPLNSTAFLVSVADASALRHEDDSRCGIGGGGGGGGGAATSPPACRAGVGRGRIVLAAREDDGRPLAFQFRLDSTPRYYPIAMGRLRDRPLPGVTAAPGAVTAQYGLVLQDWEDDLFA